ncbi:MAG: N-acetylmuramoyl-L-alanine amidase [Chloroflexi bacterium]|nr:N-acetylmuramoyl-L-alanine amidase [Chloroflexota bacterium]
MENWRDKLPEWVKPLLVYAEGSSFEGWASLAKSMAIMLDSLHPPVTNDPWDRVIIDELAHNYNCPGLLANGWWQRRVDQISHATIHGTYGWNSPHALADWYIYKGGGRPSIPYSIWITETGEVLLCNALTEGCWHDCTGHENTHLSIGMAGALHEYAPPDVQIEAAARVCVWLINNPDIPLVDGIDKITGDMDWRSTACPGWLDTGEGAPSGLWKPRFYNRLEALLG